MGGQTITHGRCGAVGASAFLMGGGIGLDMRDNGVGCDLVESVDGNQVKLAVTCARMRLPVF